MRAVLFLCVLGVAYVTAYTGYGTTALRSYWAPACSTADFVQVTLPSPTGAKVTIQARASAFFRRMHDIMYYWNWDPPAGTTGAYNCRQITGGTGYSLHAYGIAGDYDWNRNPYGSTLVTNMPSGMVDEIIAIRTVGGHDVFRWGGSYSGNKDAMHYEIIASPAQLATGLSAGTCRTSAGVAGQCVGAARCSSGGVSGLCPGAASITCCTGTVVTKRAGSGGTTTTTGGTSGGTTTTTYGSCSVVSSGVTTTGVCKDESTCNGIVTAQLCPGSASIKCCTNPSCTAGSNGDGACMKTTSCQTGYSFSGYCPGDSTIKCCTNPSTAGAAEIVLPSFAVDQAFNAATYNVSGLGDDATDVGDSLSAAASHGASIAVVFAVVAALVAAL